MIDATTPPEKDEFELTLFGPGYGESIILHVGDGRWVLVDSCIDKDGTPPALRYLESIGFNPARAVGLVVATHWHDDHIRGMARLVETCSQAIFCCASALCRDEFLAVVGALERRRFSAVGSGVREIYGVLSRLVERKSRPVYATVNRRLFSSGRCEIWSLSPDDEVFQKFLMSMRGSAPEVGRTKTRLPDLSPNEVAVALWVAFGDVAVLLGSDLERRGWVEILQSAERPAGTASAFKLPHHGSRNADEAEVWVRMLEPESFAVLTPWRRGGRALPTRNDVQRIRSRTRNGYASARDSSLTVEPHRRDRAVDRAIRTSGIELRRRAMASGAVRLRRRIGSPSEWRAETFGLACHLDNFYAF